MRVSVANGFTIVSGIHCFDHLAAQEFAASVTYRIGHELPKQVIVNLSGSKGLSSAAIVELVCLQDMLKGQNGLLVLAALSTEGRETLKAARMDSFFLSAPDLEAAKQLLRREMEV